MITKIQLHHNYDNGFYFKDVEHYSYSIGISPDLWDIIVEHYTNNRIKSSNKKYNNECVFDGLSDNALRGLLELWSNGNSGISLSAAENRYGDSLRIFAMGFYKLSKWNKITKQWEDYL